ncbi:hypothetical protein SSS_05054 [Sarcoptes scabiei]|uniref:Uncharacterized protein n=1 Tax=Sarcoptes scabiei TaxID=52283 RepID=A0A834RA38_SARSC|nr:hypothetical protein SSS_05054 [Sarcoptes scabiei]
MNLIRTPTHRSSNKDLFLILMLNLFLSFTLQPVNAVRLIIEGDNKTFTNVDSLFEFRLINEYFIPFSYKFIIEIPSYLHEEYYTQNYFYYWNHNFTNIKPGSYSLHVEVYIYPIFNNVFGWKVADAQVPLEIREHLDDYISINAKQNNSSPAIDNVFQINKTIDFVADVSASSVLARNSTVLDYHWILEGNDINKTEFKTKTFQYIFSSVNSYQITLKISAIINPEQKRISGKTASNIFIKSPIENVTVSGNIFVENGSLLNLNIRCNGSSKFLFCHRFSSIKSNTSCFQSGSIFDHCQYNVMHYFPQNGTKYVNIGIRNDVSTVFKNIKITVYKVGPTPSFAFVVIPLISLMLVTIITLIGIIHCIRQRKKMNATIEVATIENFGIFENEDETLLIEKTFFRRIKDSFKEAF